MERVMREVVAVLILILSVPQASQAQNCPNCMAPTGVACGPSRCCKNSCCSKKDKCRAFEPERNRGFFDDSREAGEYTSRSRRWGLRPLGIRWNLNIETPQFLLPTIFSADRDAEYVTQSRGAWLDDDRSRGFDDDRSRGFDCGCEQHKLPPACFGQLDQLRNEEIALRQQIEQLRSVSQPGQAQDRESIELQNRITQQQQTIAELQAELMEAKACVIKTLQQREVDVRLARMAAQLSENTTTVPALDEANEFNGQGTPKARIKQAGHQEAEPLPEQQQGTPKGETAVPAEAVELKPVRKKRWWLFGR